MSNNKTCMYNKFFHKNSCEVQLQCITHNEFIIHGALYYVKFLIISIKVNQIDLVSVFRQCNLDDNVILKSFIYIGRSSIFIANDKQNFGEAT